jgi:hypothetical protein
LLLERFALHLFLDAFGPLALHPHTVKGLRFHAP